jgi:hypothetical protein
VQDALLNQDLIPILIQLANAYDVGHQLGDEIYTGKSLVLLSLAAEQDGSTPFDVDDGAISEPDYTMNADVDVEEE